MSENSLIDRADAMPWRSPEVAVLDYGAGNLASFEGALTRLHVPFVRVQNADEWPATGIVVLPGVGHFRAAKAALRDRGLWDKLQTLEASRPLLGVCLGFQLLAEGSEEAPGEAGLGVFSGIAARLPSTGAAGARLKVPHMGWNELTARSTHALAASVPAWAYFVHSYALPISDDVVASCTYGVAFAATCARGLRVGMQHHPEKSGAAGLHSLHSALKFLAGDAPCN